MIKNYLLFILVLVCSLLNAQGFPVVSIAIDTPNVVCHPGDCVSLNANYAEVKSTDSYTVAAIPYAPQFPFVGGTQIPSIGDDFWSPEFSLPFQFCFYGQSYDKILVGTNGVITFDLVQPLNYCPWEFSTAIPDANFPIKNAIFGAYQDLDSSNDAIDDDGIPNIIQNANYYYLDTGSNAAPNRIFVANYNQLPVYQCHSDNGTQTSQIVFYESTNIIDVYIQKRSACVPWNQGNGVIGIINGDGTAAVAAPGRNTGSWEATNEAWRFIPSGAGTAQFSWFRNGVFMTHDNPVDVCDVGNDNFSAVVTYTGCGDDIAVQDNIQIQLEPEPPLFMPLDISVCGSSGPFTVNLAANEPNVLAGVNAGDYGILYYHTLADAQNLSFNYVTDPTNYVFTVDETIYMAISNEVSTGCIYVRPFNISILNVDAPSADAFQNYTTGQTLANVSVNGSDIKWYDSAIGGIQLPLSTALQNTTYYVSQTLNGCESNSRTAVTTSDNLSAGSFDADRWKVFPNPVTSILTVSKPENITLIEVYNTIGQKVISKIVNTKLAELDMSAISAGVYFVKIYSGSESKMVKVMRS